MNTSPQSKLDYHRFFSVFEVPCIICDVDDPAFTILAENDAHARMALQEGQTNVGRPVLEAFPDTSEEYLRTGKSAPVELMRRVVATGKSQKIPHMQYDIKNKRGTYTRKIWSITSYPLFDADHKVIAVYQLSEDITHKRKTELELERTQYQLKQALANGSIGTWVWNGRTNKVSTDENLATMLGIDPASAVAGVSLKQFTKSVYGEDRARVERDIRAVFAGRESFEEEYRIVAPDGGLRWVIARGHIETSEARKPTNFTGVVVDITDRKSAENNLNFLAKATAQISASLDYREILNNIASSVVPHIADWCTIDVINDEDQLELAVVLHKDPKKVAWAKRLREAQGPPDLNEPGGIQSVMRTGKPLFYPEITDEMLAASAKNAKELKLLRSLSFRSVIMAPMKINGKTIGVITLVSTHTSLRYKPIDLEMAIGLANRAALAMYNADLYQTAQRELEEREWLQEQLETANSILESRVRERTRQLLEVNRGLEQEMIKRREIEEQRMEHLVELSRSKDEFISIASHQLRTPATGVKQYIGMLLEGFIGELEPQQRQILEKAYESNERQLHIVSDLLKVAQVDAGKVRLRRARTALNPFIEDIIREQRSTFDSRQQTIRFVPHTPEIHAMIDRDMMRMVCENIIDNASKYSDEHTEVQVQLTSDEHHVEVVVSDQGVGIKASDQARLFEKFSRLSNPLSTKVGGTGLGLYWAKKIVDLHSGEVRVRSREGRGTTITIRLPK